MMKKPEQKAEKVRHIYTLPLTLPQMDALAEWLESHNWEFYAVNYSQYAYRSEGINVVAYTSGKVVIQGKNTEAFVTDVLEPEITKKPRLGLERLEHPEWFVAHAGMDESGKGDLFGPLVAACVIADGNIVDFWLKNGLKESKRSHDFHITDTIFQQLRTQSHPSKQGGRTKIQDTAHYQSYNQIKQK